MLIQTIVIHNNGKTGRWDGLDSSKTVEQLKAIGLEKLQNRIKEYNAMTSLLPINIAIEIDIQVVKPGTMGYTVSLIEYNVNKLSSSRPEIVIPDFVDTIKDLAQLITGSALREGQIIKLTQVRPLTVIADYDQGGHTNPPYYYKGFIFDLTDLNIDRLFIGGEKDTYGKVYKALRLNLKQSVIIPPYEIAALISKQNMYNCYENILKIASNGGIDKNAWNSNINNIVNQYLDWKGTSYVPVSALLIPGKPIQTSREYGIVNPKDYKLIIHDFDRRYREEWESGGGEREDHHITWIDNPTPERLHEYDHLYRKAYINIDIQRRQVTYTRKITGVEWRDPRKIGRPW